MEDPFDELHVDDDIIDARVICAWKKPNQDGVPVWSYMLTEDELGYTDPRGAQAAEVLEPDMANPASIDADFPAFLESLTAEGATWHKWQLHELVHLSRPPGLEDNDPRPPCVCITFVLWREPQIDKSRAFWWCLREEDEMMKKNPKAVENWRKM